MKHYIAQYKFLILTDSMFKMSSSLLIPVFSIFVLSLGGNLRHLGDLLGIYGLTYAIAAYYISKHFLQYKFTLLITSYSIWIIYCILLLMVSNIYVLYPIMFIGGIGVAIKYPILFKHFQDEIADPNNLNKIYNAYHLIGKAIGAIFAFIGGYASHFYGFDILFSLMLGVGIISLTLSILYTQVSISNIKKLSRDVLNINQLELELSSLKNPIPKKVRVKEHEIVE